MAQSFPLHQAPLPGAEALAKAIDPKARHYSWRCRCPAHDDGQASLDIVDGEICALWICRAGCSQEDVTEALRRLGLIGGQRRETAPRPAPARSRPTDKPSDPDRPRRLFDTLGKPIKRTPVEAYLKYRCGPDVVLPSDDALRYWAAIPPHYQ